MDLKTDWVHNWKHSAISSLSKAQNQKKHFTAHYLPKSENSKDNYSTLSSNTHTHTHPFNGPFSGTTRVGRYQKGKTNLDFTEERDSEWQWHQLGHMQVCTLLTTGNHASTSSLSFLQAGCPYCCPTNSVKALKATARKATLSSNTHTHTHTQSLNGNLSGSTWVGRYQKKYSRTHTHPDHRTSFIIFLHLQRSMASSLFSLRAW